MQLAGRDQSYTVKRGAVRLPLRKSSNPLHELKGHETAVGTQVVAFCLEEVGQVREGEGDERCEQAK